MKLIAALLFIACVAVELGAASSAHAQQQPQRPSDEQIDARIQSFSVQVQNATNEVILMREQIIMLSVKLKKAEDELAKLQSKPAEK